MTFPKGRKIILLGVAVAMLANACQNDAPYGPKPPDGQPTPLASSRSANLAQSAIRVAGDNGGSTHGALDWTGSSVNLPPSEWVVLTVPGGVTLQTNPACLQYPGCNFPLSGQTINAFGIYPEVLKVHIKGLGYADIQLNPDGNGVPSAMVWSGSGGVISMMRGGIQDGYGCIGHAPDINGVTGCPPPNGMQPNWYLGAYTMTSNQQLVAKLVDPLIVHGSPTSIHPGQVVHFTATLGGAASLTQRVWLWVNGEVGNNQQDAMQANGLPLNGINPGCAFGDTCDFAPPQSGRMYAVAQDNATGAYAHGSSEYITVNAGTLRLVPSPSSITRGAIVTFTPSTSDGSPYTIQSWSFQADKGTDGGSFSPCAPSANPCRYAVPYTGTMYMTALVNGVSQLATAHVTVTPCLSVNDSLLDNPGIVDSLHAALLLSGAYGTPGTGAIKEYGGLIWKRPDGTYFVTYLTPTTTSECGISFPGAPYYPPPSELGAHYIAGWHTHPSYSGQDVYGCPANIYGQKQAQVFGDGLPIPVASPELNGGGSEDDWAMANTGTQYVINADGVIWRLDPGVLKSQHANNTHKYDWVSSPGCAKPAT